jgi:outer membrane lipopolysaccharide assembly protein LptE/RlpB
VDVTLRVQGFAFEIEDGAVDAQVRVVEKIARLTVEVAALDALGEALAEPWIIEVSQAFRTDRTQLLGSFGQQSQIEEALYQNVASRIVRSLDVLIRMQAGGAQAGIPGSESDAG